MHSIEDRVNNIIKYLVVASDFLLLNLLLTVIFFVVSPNHVSMSHGDGSFRMLLLVANAAMAVAQIFVPTKLHLRRVSISDIIPHTTLLITICSLLMIFGLKFISYPGHVIRVVLICGALHILLQIILRLCERGILNFYRARGGNTHYVTLVGDDPAILMVYEQICKDPATGYEVRGYYADYKLDNAPAQLQYLGTLTDLNAEMDSTINDVSMQRHDDDDTGLSASNDIFCSLSHVQNTLITKIMNYCDHNVIHFFYVPRMVGNFHLNLKMDRLGDIPLFTNHVEPLSILSNRLIKRTFDLLFSGVVCIFLLPITTVVAIIIKIQSPGPIFFRQARTGLNGNNFMMLKFRSMHVNKDADTLQATKNDPRKYPFGNFMRKTSIDELPQFFNVFLGDMSVVGPRPHMQKHTEIYSQAIQNYMVRHLAKPGITGWAQVTGWRGETETLDKMEGRVRADIWYVENWSFWLDIKIILMTLRNAIKGDEEAY